MNRRKFLKNIMIPFATLPFLPLWVDDSITPTLVPNENVLITLQDDEIGMNPNGDDLGWQDYDPTAKTATIDWSSEPSDKDTFLFGPNEGI